MFELEKYAYTQVNVMATIHENSDDNTTMI